MGASLPQAEPDFNPADALSSALHYASCHFPAQLGLPLAVTRSKVRGTPSFCALPWLHPIPVSVRQVVHGTYRVLRLRSWHKFMSAIDRALPRIHSRAEMTFEFFPADKWLSRGVGELSTDRALLIGGACAGSERARRLIGQRTDVL
jgi:hypothetical protein